VNASTRPFPLGSDDLRLLARIGFVAATNRQGAVARSLFSALRVVRPDSAAPPIGLAMAEIGVGRPSQAVRLLRDEGLVARDGAGAVRAFLGLALAEAGQWPEAERVLREVVDAVDTVDEPNRQMALRLLQMRDDELGKEQPHGDR
jgi:hypothetical protein